MNKHIARVCWNSERWTRPTGEAARLESPGSFVVEQRFGHEEWLFALEWVVDGWKYSFLQPVNRSYDKLSGKVLDVILYTIGPGRTWYYVGEIAGCEVLTTEQARLALKEFRDRGWLGQMKEQVKAVGGNPGGLSGPPHGLLNVRFRPRAALLYDSMPQAGADDALRRVTRYLLAEVSGSLAPVASELKRRRAAAGRLPTGTRTRRGVAPVTYELQHNAVQNELIGLLQRKYGKRAVQAEADYVDLRLDLKDGTRLIEIKTDPSPRRAVREAIGQLLEHAFRLRRRDKQVMQLIVVGPGELPSGDDEFVNYVRDAIAVPVRYVQFRSGATSVDI